jgi:hypothetical protein
VGAERKAKERARFDGDPGGAPADGEGAPGGVKDVNLQQHALVKPLVNPKRSEGRRRRWSFTDGGACTAAAGTRGGGAGELSSSKRVGVLGGQREAQAIECELK